MKQAAKQGVNPQFSKTYQTLNLLWIVIIAMQWIDFTEPLWFAVTTTLVTVTILMMALVEWLLPLPAAWKWTIKIILLLTTWRFILTSYGVYIPYGPFFPDQIRGMALTFTPYIWFSLIAWALLEAVLRLVVGRPRILIFLAAHLIAFAILDSFTPYYLWTNVAWIVFAGLGWLVSTHFYEYRKKYPQGWQRLRQSPIKIAVNIGIVFACVLLIGISMPSVSPTLTDPYTAWIKRSGSGGGGPSALSGSLGEGPSAVKEEVVSGYSRDDKSLGDGFEFSYSPVMSIDTPVRSYWRGETRRIYSGTGWSDLEREGRETERYRGALEEDPLVHEQPGKVETMRVEQTVTMNTDKVYPVLFGGYAIESVELLDERQQPDMRWAGKQAELFWNGFRNPGDLPDYPRKYKVVANIPLIPLDELQQADYEALYPEGAPEEYLQLPNNLPQRVKDLAKEITAEGGTPYAKMDLLQTYLRQNYEYTNKPDLARKRSDDFVDSFLFEIRQGYCDYYSTAMVVMARSLGVPARWVKGYAPGSQPSDEMLMRNPELGRAYNVSNADAHSWAELYFGDYGWIPFEATPGFLSPVMLAPEESEEAFAPDTEPEPEVSAAEDGFFSKLDPVVMQRIFLSAVSVLVVWTLYQLRSQLYYLWLRLRLGRPLTSGEKAIYETLRLVKRLRRRGLTRGDQETLREAFGRWKLERPQLAEVLDPLLLLYEQANYGRSPAAADWRAAREMSRKAVKLAGGNRWRQALPIVGKRFLDQ
ncbi:transglutaminase-like domain-containing protein [Paenibacillus phocaensis]|uniref:transglutaminase-like domain-containing protein n=1 Tax=Paenibacillus phocaensis TaxID=1776378 RepID=UPI000839B614|nr:transglutaminase-like domain-containing protein [Paenibacillus phocaensis]